MATNGNLMKKIVYMYLQQKGEFSVFMEKDEIRVAIESTQDANGYTFLSMILKYSFMPTHNFQFEILDKYGHSAFCFHGQLSSSYSMSLYRFCNLTTLKQCNSNIESTYLNNSLLCPNHVKIAFSVWNIKPTFPQSVVKRATTNGENAPTMESLRLLLNEEAFNDSDIETEKLVMIKRLSTEALQSVIKVSNAVTILQLAQKYDEERLKKATVDFIIANLQEVMETDGWKNIPEAMGKQLLAAVLISLGPAKAKLESVD